ncbi:MAG: hypothetical protein M1497_11630 [Nitrospirae bacterium]|nr:hypothetical protein [Nitrospirota bacterium]
MFKKGNEYYLVINPSLPDGPECIAQFDPRSGEAAVYCGKADMVEAGGREMLRNPFTYPLDQLLLMYVLAHKEGALLHASAVDFGGRGYLFPGRSGAGKSTISRYLAAKGHEVLSDDRVAVRNMKTGFSIFGTPWSGEARIAANANLPLHGIFFVGHGSENRIEEIPPGEAARRLMPVTSIPWFDREAVTAILLFCEDLVLNVPAYDLHFIPGAEVVSFFEEFIS